MIRTSLPPRCVLTAASRSAMSTNCNGQRGPSRQPRDHHEAVARQVDIDILEIVLPRAADPDLLLHEVRAGEWVPVTLAWEGGRWERNKPAYAGSRSEWLRSRSPV